MASFALICCPIFIAILTQVRQAASFTDGLGPGKGEWVVSEPEKYGLDKKELAAAVDMVGKLVPERGCLLITKGGEIIVEDYYDKFGADTKWETDSMAKTFVAALFGIVVEKGIVDLDKPLAEYGMPPHPSDLWNRTGVDYWPNVTARHLLTQTSGYGVVVPGTKMTYDSNAYIQHLSYFLSHVRFSAQHFATHFFAKPLGVPELFVYDSQRWFPGLANEISAGGGQMVTCREAARIGQFVLNRGMWRDVKGAPVRLGNEDYFHQMLQPAYPGVVDGYGFLTWLNVDQSKQTSTGKPRSHCCGPRFGGNKKVCTKNGTQCAWCCEAQAGYTNTSVPCQPSINAIDPTYKQANLTGASMYVGNQIIGEDLPPNFLTRSPESLGIGFGQYAKYMLMLPESNMQIISMGMSYGKSLNCPDAYNDMTSLAFLWSALAKALKMDEDVCAKGSTCDQSHAAPKVFSTSSTTNGTSLEEIAEEKPPRPRRTRHHRRDLLLSSGPPPESSQSIGGGIWKTLTHTWSKLPSLNSFLGPRVLFPPPTPKPDENPVVGSCLCGCPPDMLTGMCFNVKSDHAPSDKDCTNVRVPRVMTLPSVCPTVGLVLQCDPAVFNGTAECSNETLQGGGMKCHSTTPCQPVPGLPSTWEATCQCVPTEWIDDSGEPKCTWSDQPCVFSGYVTP